MYHWVDHTAELELRIEAASEEGVFAEALAAFRELVGEEDGGEALLLDVAVEAADRPALLAEWLGELVFLAETQDFVPERVARLELAAGELRAQVEGRRGRPSHLVKAVTLHGLELGCDDGLWRARLVLDV